VLGTTTPLYTGLMALAWRLGLHDLPSVALLLNAVSRRCDSSVLLYWLARRARAAAGLWRLALALAWPSRPMNVTLLSAAWRPRSSFFFLVASFTAYVAGRSRLSAGAHGPGRPDPSDALHRGWLLFADMGLRPLLCPGWWPAGPLRLRGRLPVGRAGHLCRLLAPWSSFATLILAQPIAPVGAGQGSCLQLIRSRPLSASCSKLSTPSSSTRSWAASWPAIGLPLYLVLYLVGGLRQVRQAGRTLRTSLTLA